MGAPPLAPVSPPDPLHGQPDLDAKVPAPVQERAQKQKKRREEKKNPYAMPTQDEIKSGVGR